MLKHSTMARFWIQNPIMLSLLLFFFFFTSSSQNDDVDGRSGSGHEQVRVGLVLDMGSAEGKMVRSSISMALSDFYAINGDYKTRVSLSIRDSHGEPLLALASAEDLLRTVGVEVIIGGRSLLETKLLAEIGEKAQIPVISLNSPISLALRKYNYLFQVTHDSTSEANGVTSFIHGFDWNIISLVYEDEDDWRESMQLMVNHFHEKGIRIRSKQGFTVFSSEDFLIDRLQKLKDLGTTIFVVHLSERIATLFFQCAGKLGMMGDGFAWILTVNSMNSFHEDFSKEAMEGVVGFRSYIPISKELHNFTLRWRKSLHVEQVVGWLSISGVWAHDIAGALARVAEVARMQNVSSTLLEEITKSRFNGLSGDFQLVDKKLLSDKFEIVNMMGSGERRVGFWNSNGSFSNRRHLSSTHNNLETIIWPGGSAQNPKDSSRKKLKVLVTSSNRFPHLMNVTTDQRTNVTTADGFCIEVFRASIRPLNYELEYIPWLNGSNYNNLAYALYSQKENYDAAVGDITITSNRSTYVDFTMPFTEMGLGIVAQKERSMWVFLQPLTLNLWITSAAFFFLTGIVVWLIERSENTEFQGSWSQQIGVALWFGFSTLVYAHRERLKHNISRFIVIVWVFSVLILTTSYTATLTSMITVQQIRLNSNEDYVGHLSGSLIANAILNAPSLRKMKSLGLNNSEEYAQALLNKTVSFIVDELPYLKVLLAQNPAHILMVKTESTTNGFGFMFQKGSELVHNVSQEIANLRTSKRLHEIERRYFENQLLDTEEYTSNPLTLYKFRGLFMITGVSFAFALAIPIIIWLRKKCEVVVNSVKIFFLRRFIYFKILFARIIHHSPLDDTFGVNAVQMTQGN